MGNEGNERADVLAKQGTSHNLLHIPLPNNPNFLPTPIPLSHVKTTQVKDLFWELFEAE